ncbi:unnamed protein product [Lepeophtheirus salmonis]|uniref:(salmon louse) hypothetical protein n=1 Tax=Lepeophtheirus salmonis TaxID=72036 RepID=A0A7R8CEW8_LEPSM|nr:unnamed protein product [Lepeophtheirus salmonis]CAF2795427.1 unnamed protein product [Lepeophtheirus salmonis]
MRPNCGQICRLWVVYSFLHVLTPKNSSLRVRTSRFSSCLQMLFWRTKSIEEPKRNTYKEALQCKKHYLKLKGGVGVGGEEDLLLSDVNIKYKIYVCQLKTSQPPAAFSTLQSIPAKQRSPRVNMALGQLYYHAGMERPAIACYKEVLKACPLAIEAAQILMHLGVKAKEINSLTLDFKCVSEDLPEPWTAMGYYSYLNKKSHRAVYFAHKACMIQSRSIEALLLKGNLLLDLKKVQDAMNHFREAIQLAPYRFECHKGLVECYLGQSRYREAVTLAAAANLQLNRSARSLTLYASVADPCYLPAVYLLAELLEQEMNFDEAITLLRKQLTLQTTCKLHQMLADLLAKTNEEEKGHGTLRNCPQFGP